MKKISKVHIFSPQKAFMIVETRKVIIPYIYSINVSHGIELPSNNMTSEEINLYIQKAIQ